PGHGTGRQRDVHDDDKAEIDRDSPPNDKPRQRRLQRERGGDRDDDARRPQSLPPARPGASRWALSSPGPLSAASCAGVGVTTLSTSSSAEKSTPGRTIIRR